MRYSVSFPRPPVNATNTDRNGVGMWGHVRSEAVRHDSPRKEGNARYNPHAFKSRMDRDPRGPEVMNLSNARFDELKRRAPMLPEGVDWRPELGNGSRPVGDPVGIDDTELPARPRQSRDGDLYCVTCPRTLRRSPQNQKVLCTDCSAARSKVRLKRHRERARASDSRPPTGGDAARRIEVDMHLAALKDLQAAVGAAVARKGKTGSADWADQLLLAAKTADVTADFLRRPNQKG